MPILPYLSNLIDVPSEPTLRLRSYFTADQPYELSLFLSIIFVLI